MLWNASALIGAVIDGSDGPLGTTTDLLFQEGSWALPWLALDIGAGLGQRRTLLPAAILSRPDGPFSRTRARLTRQQVMGAPPFDPEAPVTSDLEAACRQHYGPCVGDNHPPMLGFYAPPFSEPVDAALGAPPHPGRDRLNAEPSPDAPRLRSVRSACGLRAEGVEGAIGRLDHFLIDPAAARVRRLSIRTGEGPARDQLRVSTLCVERIDWVRREIQLDVRKAPVSEPPAMTLAR